MIAEDQLDNSIDVASITQIVGKQAVIKTKSKDGKDQFTYTVNFNPFKIVMTVNEIETITVNSYDSLFFENFNTVL